MELTWNPVTPYRRFRPCSEMRSGMAIVIMGGMISATLLTLVFIPVVYTLVDDSTQWLKKLLGIRTAEINIDDTLK